MFENCVILAGGKSLRFGQDKSLVEFLDEPSLTHFCVKKMSKIFSNVFVCAKNMKFDPPLNLISDLHDDFSPMLALHSVLCRFKNPVFIMPVDMPFIDYFEILKMSEFVKKYEIVIAKSGEKEHNLCGFFDPNLSNLARDFYKKNDHKISNLIKVCKSKVVEFDDEDIFLNLNTQSELKKALELCRLKPNLIN